MRKSTAAKADVRRAAESLITLHGKTTSLDVKNQLRAEEFWATQREVSDMLQEIAREDGYDVQVDTSTGHNFNVYSRQTQAQTVSVPHSNSGSVVDRIIAIIFNIFGFSATESDRFDAIGIDSGPAFGLIKNDACTELGIDPGHDRSKFHGTDFADPTSSHWAGRTVGDFAAACEKAMAWNQSSSTFHNTASGVEAAVGRIISDTLGVDSADVTPNADIIVDLGADELDLVELIMEAESEFNISISDDQVEKIKTVGDFVSHVQSVLAPGSQQASSPAPVPQTTIRKVRAKVTAKPLFVIPSATTLDSIKSGYNGSDWVVYSTKGTERCIFSGAESRDHIRSAYATAHGQQMKDVRARRVGRITPGVKHLG
jgi:acyl carrier protein